MTQTIGAVVGHQCYQDYRFNLKWRKSWLLSVLLGLAVSLLSASVLADPAHFFVLKESADGSLIVNFHLLVQIDGPIDSNAMPSSHSKLERRLRVTLDNKATGVAAFDTVAFGSPWIRAEFHGKGPIDGRVFPVDDRLYVVRVPVTKGAMLRATFVPDGTDALRPAVGMRPALEVDLDAFLASKVGPTLQRLPAGYVSGSVTQNGPSSNRLDLLIVAEGYTASQQSQFVAQATALATTLLSIEPYASFSHLLNVSWLFVPSNQSGADKPSCSETPGSAVVSVDTAFDGTFCTNNIRRLVTVNSSKLLAATANVPDWDKILVLVNDDEYGGSGGAEGVATTNAYSAEIMQHEFAHQFSLLADEYETAYPGFPACNDSTSGNSCEANVTNQTQRADIKWKGWFAAATPIPTFGALADSIETGLWQGARYQTAGLYRQCFNGLMRSLGRPFCHVDSEAFVKRLYGGWGGSPAQGVSLIEPGAVPASNVLSAPIQADIVFQGTLAGSKVVGAKGGLTYAWLVNGVTQKMGGSDHGVQQSFVYRVANAGPNTVELRASDNTSFMLTAPVRSRVWTVQGTPSKGVFGLSISKAGNGTITSSPAGINCGATCTANYVAGSTVTLTAKPSTGATFLGWGGSCSGTAATCSVSMSSARSVSASFSAVNTAIVCNTAPSVSYPNTVQNGTSGNDVLSSTAGNDAFNGFAGLDTVVYTCARSSFVVTKTIPGWTVGSAAEGTDMLADIERIRFSERTLALDIDGNAGKVYRTYQAAFNRVPDNGGLKYWITVMDSGASLDAISGGFVTSAEFRAVYGANPTDAQYVTRLYDNVLHRAPEQSGFDFWVSILARGAMTRAQVLAAFAESAENKAGVLSAISNGIDLLD